MAATRSRHASSRYRGLESEPAQRRRIGRNDDPRGLDLGAGFQHHPRQLLTRVDRCDSLPRPYLDPQLFEISPERCPEAAVIVVSRYVEEQPFRRAEKVCVEHRDELAGGEIIGMGKEATGEHLQCQVPSPAGKAKSIKEIRRALAVIPAERAREVDVQQFEGCRHVHGSKITKSE